MTNLMLLRSVVCAGDETHLNLLPHVRASWTLRRSRPHIPTPGKNRQVTVFGAIEVTSGRWVCRLGRRCAAGFIAFLRQLAQAFPCAPVIVVICDNDTIHHAHAVTAYLENHPRLELLYGARYSPHDNPFMRADSADSDRNRTRISRIFPHMPRDDISRTRDGRGAGDAKGLRAERERG